MKKGKIVLLHEDEKFSVKIGTVDNKSPKALYMTISSWISPIKMLDEGYDYDRVISNMRKAIKQNIYDNIDNDIFYSDKTIVDLDLRSSGIVMDKKSYMNCEITLFQKLSESIKSPLINKSFSVLSNNILSSVMYDNKYFTFFRKK